MRRVSFWGPPQIWQRYPYQWTSDVSPERRLYLAGDRGLPVGKDAVLCGGVKTNVADRLVGMGIAWVSRDSDGRPVRIFPRQLSFNF